jgi:tellurite resistance protein TerC
MEMSVKHLAFSTLGQAKRLVIIVIGFTILAAGVAMIVLPGPAVVVIPVGLALLATEFLWARKLLVTVKEQVDRMRKGLRCQNNQ